LRHDARKKLPLLSIDPPRKPRYDPDTIASLHSQTFPPMSNVPYGLSERSLRDRRRRLRPRALVQAASLKVKQAGGPAMPARLR